MPKNPNAPNAYFRARDLMQTGLYRDVGVRSIQGEDRPTKKLWQTDVTYLKVIGWVRLYLSEKSLAVKTISAPYILLP